METGAGLAGMRVDSVYPVVPNPYTILTTVPSNHGWFSVLALKDAFYSVVLDKDSRDLFAFEWEDPESHIKTHLRWTMLPQGFVDSCIIWPGVGERP